MNTYKNVAFKKRNYDCTNVVYFQSKTDFGKSLSLGKSDWKAVEVKELEASNCVPLFVEGNKRFFGYM